MADIPDSRGAGARLVGCGAGCQPGCGGAGHPRQTHPVQNSPGIRASRAQPVQNSPRTPQNADFGPLSGCWANFVTLGLQTDHAGRTLYRIRGLCRDKALPARSLGRPTRYKTLPARTPGGPTRYKTLPARPKTPISAHFPGAGRILSRSGCKQTTQGELCTAFGACAGTKLSRLAALADPPGTKLSQHVPPAGPPGTKLSPLAPPAGPPGTKLSPHAPKRRLRPTFRTQGEFYTASTTNKPSREKKVTHRHPTAPHQRTLPQFRMQFDCMKFQQHPETLQFQRSHFKSRNTPRGIACEIIRSHSAGGRQQCQGGAHSITSIAGVKGVGGHGRATHSNKPRLIGGAAMPAGPSRTTSRLAEQSSPRGRFAGSHAAQQPGHTAERPLGSRKSGRPRGRPEIKRGNRQATQAAGKQTDRRPPAHTASPLGQPGHARGQSTRAASPRGQPGHARGQSTRAASPRGQPGHADSQATRMASPRGWPVHSGGRKPGGTTGAATQAAGG